MNNEQKDQQLAVASRIAEQTLWEMDNRIKGQRERLLVQAKSLRDRMDYLVRGLEAGENRFNSLGEVQGMGSSVDTGCAVLAELVSLQKNTATTLALLVEKEA